MEQAPSAGELRRIEGVLDRIEDRLRDAAPGWHAAGPPADPDQLDASALPVAARGLWARWDGLVLAHGETRIYAVAELSRVVPPPEEVAPGLRAGDIVIGERGRDALVLAADPWEEGADVVLVEEDGQRSPYASDAPLLVLGVLGELDVLHDEEGEFREDLFGEDAELTERAERKLLRRRLDLDPDAPLARYRLGQLLRRAGDARAAVVELKAVVKRAPSWPWAQLELGRALAALEPSKTASAERAFAAAAEAAADDGLRGLCLAWAARVASEERRSRHAEASRAAYPELAAAHEAAARAAVELGEFARARELVAVGLAVHPRHAGLLALAAALAQREG